MSIIANFLIHMLIYIFMKERYSQITPPQSPPNGPGPCLPGKYLSTQRMRSCCSFLSSEFGPKIVVWHLFGAPGNRKTINTNTTTSHRRPPSGAYLPPWWPDYRLTPDGGPMPCKLLDLLHCHSSTKYGYQPLVTKT